MWSYHHFFRRTHIPLFLDLASPPLLAERSTETYFFSGGHPLSRYFSRYGLRIPELDTSGGNVTYAAVSLAEALGAETTGLYGADFAYPLGVTYARGTWLYPFYDKQQNRFAPTETYFSQLLYRTPLEKRCANGTWYYETPVLAAYRARLEERKNSTRRRAAEKGAVFTSAYPAVVQSGKTHGGTFLAEYRERLRSLSFQNPSAEDRIILTTLLPAAAALKRRNPDSGKENLPEAPEAARDWCVKRIEKVMEAKPPELA
jgi:hypothetical protein